jgi:hypothetical protein
MSFSCGILKAFLKKSYLFGLLCNFLHCFQFSMRSNIGHLNVSTQQIKVILLENNFDDYFSLIF